MSAKRATKRTTKKSEPPVAEEEQPVEQQDDQTSEGQSQEALPKVEDAEKRTGIKEGAQNEDAMAQEKERVEASEEVNKQTEDALPSFFVDKKKRHRVVVDVLSSKGDGRVMTVVRANMGLNFATDFSYLRHTVVWFDFTLPDYEQVSDYRQRCAVYRREAQQMLVDKVNFRNHVLVRHLKDWNITDTEGKKVELDFDEDTNFLSNPSIDKVYNLHSTIIDVVMTVLEKDTLLS